LSSTSENYVTVLGTGRPKDYIFANTIQGSRRAAHKGPTLDFGAIDVTRTEVYAVANEVLN